MFAEGVRQIKASEAGLLGALEMPLVPLWGWLFLSEIPGVPTFVGGAIVMVTLGWYLASSQRGASSQGVD